MFLTRRRALGATALLPAGLAGCALVPNLSGLGTGFPVQREGRGPVRTLDYAKVYAARAGEPHPVRAFDYTNTDPTFLRADISYVGPEPAGTIVVEPKRHVLFLVEENGRATRYGIAVGREAAGFAGGATVAARRAWPDRDRSEATAARTRSAWAQLEAGPPAGEPARGAQAIRGARALLLARNGFDTGLSVHGTPDPDTVGTDVAAGCFALIDQDVIDLFDRTREGTRVMVVA